jgi:hypothetical protein
MARQPIECEALIAYRNSDKLQQQLKRMGKDFILFGKQYKIFDEQLKEFKREYSANSLKWQSLFDALLLTANTTGNVLSTILPSSFINISNSKKVSEQVLESVEMVRYGIDVYKTESLEDRVKTNMLREADNYGGVVKSIGKIFQGLEVVTSLLEAKERFKDRKETISLLNKIERELRSNNKKFNKKYTKSIQDIDALNKMKNSIDGFCNSKTIISTGESDMYHSKSMALSLGFITAVNKGKKSCINDNGYNVSLVLMGHSCKPSPYTKNEFKCNVNLEVTCEAIKCKKYYCGTEKEIKNRLKHL